MRRLSHSVVLGVMASLLYIMPLPLIATETTSTNKVGQTVITSREMLFEHAVRTAWFDGNVELVDPEVSLSCDKLMVVFNEDGDVERAEALGNVIIHQAGRRGTCQRALYTAHDGMVIMLKDARDPEAVQARLMDGSNALTGDEIRIFLHKETVLCKPGRLVIFPDEKPGATGLNAMRRKTEGR